MWKTATRHNPMALSRMALWMTIKPSIELLEVDSLHQQKKTSIRIMALVVMSLSWVEGSHPHQKVWRTIIIPTTIHTLITIPSHIIQTIHNIISTNSSKLPTTCKTTI